MPGDQIILANGSYTTSGPITVARAGTVSQPILISAQTVGGATISGSGAFTVNSPAAFVTIQGFIFNHVGVFSVNPGANHIQVTRNTFNNGAGGQDLNVNASDDNQLDHNLFENRPNGGQFISLTNQGGTCAGGNALRNWIHHNHFIHNNGGGGNGADPIENGGDSTATEQMTAEFNLFEDCNADPETISNKSSDNVIRYNTLRGNRSHIELRDGNNVQVYGNFVLNSQGIRIFGDDHQIYNNYLAGNDVGIRVGAGSTADHICGQPFGGNDNPDRVHIFNNTLVNNTQSVLGESRILCATDLLFANNIEQSDTGTFFQWNCTPVNPTYEGNIVWGNAGLGALPASGATRVNPLLVADANGIFHISAGSPAINAEVGSFPVLVDDMDGQPRDTASDGKPPDVGADELSNAPITRRPLFAADVGPNAFESDFSITATAPTTQTVNAGASTSFGVTVATISGTPGTVTFGVTGLPAGANGTFSPSSVTNSGSSTLNVTTSTSTPTGTYTLTISGATATVSHSTTVTLIVKSGADFTLSLSPSSQTVAAGSGTIYTASVAAVSGFSGTVMLTVSCPAAISCGISPSSVTASGSATVTVGTTSSTAAGTYTVTVTGTSGTLSHTATASLTVTSVPDFSFSVTPPSQTVNAGSSAIYTASATALNGFNGTISLSVSGVPAGVSCAFNPTTIVASGSSQLTCTTTVAVPGTTLTVTGASGSLSHSGTATLTVNSNSCVTATANATWNNTTFPSHSGTFTATFDATPSVPNQSSAVALSHGAQTSFAGFANIVVFTTAGTIQARNGSGYAAASTINFTGGITYHFRLAINVTTHTYSIFVTPPGGSELTVGMNFNFRTEQNTVTSLDHWGALVNATPGGTLKVCNFTAQ